LGEGNNGQSEDLIAPKKIVGHLGIRPPIESRLGPTIGLPLALGVTKHGQYPKNHRPESGPKRAPKRPQKCPKMAPKRPQKCPKMAPNGPQKCPESAPKVPQKCPKTCPKTRWGFSVGFEFIGL